MRVSLNDGHACGEGVYSLMLGSRRWCSAVGDTHCWLLLALEGLVDGEKIAQEYGQEYVGAGRFVHLGRLFVPLLKS